MTIKTLHNAKIYITEDGFFRAELWEVHEEMIWQEQTYFLHNIDDEGDYVYKVCSNVPNIVSGEIYGAQKGSVR